MSAPTVAIQSAPGQATAARTRTLVATVTAVDAAQRSVTLKGPQGREVPLKVGPDVRNLEQVAVGDKVVVKYLESLSLTLMKDGKALRGGVETGAAARTPPGDKPGGIVAEQVEVTADVVAVDPKQQTITLKGPQQTVEMRVPDAKQFRLVKVGDQVDFTWSEAVQVTVDAPK